MLGNKIEMQITDLVEQNSTLLRVGLHFEFNDARNRVSRQLQKNLDTCEYAAVYGSKGRHAATPQKQPPPSAAAAAPESTQ